jgi:glycosyltransferase involved in cell wall biosynthesis
MKLKIVQLTTDNRWPFKQYDKPAPWFGAAPEALLSGFAHFPEEIEVHVVSTIRRPAPAPVKLAENIFFHSLHVPKIGWMRTAYLGCLFATRRKLRELKPDLVHGQGSEGDAAICAALSGFPNVITLLGIMKEMVRVMHARPGSFYSLAATIESVALRRTAGVFCNSRFVQEKIRSRCKKTWIVPNAVREPFFDKPLSNAPPAKCVILNAGTVCAYKRQNELIALADELHAEGLPFELHFLGMASPANDYGRKFFSLLQNKPYLVHHGHKSTDEVIAQLDGATALVHVSQIETFGLVVAEALARNLKVFAFKENGVADIIENAQGAEGFADGDWSGLKNAMTRWIRNGFPKPLNAAAAMRERFHPATVARRHLEIYREVLGR